MPTTLIVKVKILFRESFLKSHKTFLQICRWFSGLVQWTIETFLIIIKTPLPFFSTVFCPSWFHEILLQNFDLNILNQIWCLFTFLLSLYRYWDLSEKNLLIICAKAPNYSQFLFKAWQWNYWQIKTKLSQALLKKLKIPISSLHYFLKDCKMKLKTNKMSDHHARSEVKSTRKLNSPWLETTCLR